MVPLKRSAGILLPVFSLPSPWGVGTLGEAARDFVRFLEAAGQSYWQVLPLGETSFGDSPYQPFSSYAGNPYLIDLDLLRADGLLTAEDYQSLPWGEDPRRVDYAHIYQYCYDVLHKAYTRFDQSDADYQSFCRQQEAWLPEYALFMALKNANGGKPWYLWEKPLAMHEPDAIATAKKLYQDDIAFYCVMQYWFHKQWYKLKHYCNKRGITIVGDIPIYVAYDSVEVWSQPELFQLDQDSLVPLKSRTNTFTHMAEYPMTDYDISLLLDGSVQWKDVLQTVGGIKSELLHGASFVDEYRGKQVPAGKKSLTLRLSIGSKEKTLTSSEIEEVASNVLNKIAKRFGAELRR